MRSQLPFLLALLSLTLARAQTPATSELEALRAELDAIQSLPNDAEPACPTALPASDDILIAFDGMKGYCPRLARFGLRRWDRPGSPWADGLRLLPEREYRERTRAVRAEQGFSHRCYLIDPVVRESVLVLPARPVLYYSQKGYRESLACVRSLRERAREAGRGLRVSILGYSLGGAAALRLSRSLVQDGARVTAVLTLDPVGNLWRAVGSTVWDGGSPRFFRVPDGVEAWTNYYQETDRISISHTRLFPIGIRGNRVRGAINQRLAPEWYPHVGLLDEPEVRDALRKVLQAPSG